MIHCNDNNAIGKAESQRYSVYSLFYLFISLAVNTMLKKIVLFVLMSYSFISFAQQPLELEWEDLVPKDFVAAAPNLDHIGQAMAGPQTINAPVVAELDGKLVKIPGFVVPLEGDETTVTEFLLVPYFGACIHVPPPPSNQIIHVTFKKGAPAEALYDPIYLIGTLSNQEWKGELAQVGYTMIATDYAPYDDF